MINFLHSLAHNPDKGWDPIPPAYATDYEQNVATLETGLVDRLESALGGLRGKTIADLGSGPGQYALEFARRGALVSCIDVSNTYLEMARRRLQSAGLPVETHCAYIDRVDRYGKFDAVFSNVSWYYCMDDFRFARHIARALKPAGVVLIRASNSQCESRVSRARRVAYWFNRHLKYKIGHPHPDPGRIEAALRLAGLRNIRPDYSDPQVDVVIAQGPL